MNFQSKNICTDYFCVPASVYARETTEQIISNYWWLALVIILPVCYGIIIDWRWLIVAGIVICIAIPTLLMFGWIYLLAQPGIWEATFPTSICYDAALTSLHINYRSFPSDMKADNDDSQNDKMDHKPMISPDNTSHAPLSFTCTSDEIVFCGEWKNYIRLKFKSGTRIRQLLIPVSSFRTPFEATAFFTDINAKIYPEAYSPGK